MFKVKGICIDLRIYETKVISRQELIRLINLIKPISPVLSENTKDIFLDTKELDILKASIYRSIDIPPKTASFNYKINKQDEISFKITINVPKEYVYLVNNGAVPVYRDISGMLFQHVSEFDRSYYIDILNLRMHDTKWLNDEQNVVDLIAAAHNLTIAINDSSLLINNMGDYIPNSTFLLPFLKRVKKSINWFAYKNISNKRYSLATLIVSSKYTDRLLDTLIDLTKFYSSLESISEGNSEDLLMQNLTEHRCNYLNHLNNAIGYNPLIRLTNRFFINPSYMEDAIKPKLILDINSFAEEMFSMSPLAAKPYEDLYAMTILSYEELVELRYNIALAEHDVDKELHYMGMDWIKTSVTLDPGYKKRPFIKFSYNHDLSELKIMGYGVYNRENKDKCAFIRRLFGMHYSEIIYGYNKNKEEFLKYVDETKTKKG